MRTKYINRLIGRITASNQSNNDSFDFHIDLQSGTPDIWKQSLIPLHTPSSTFSPLV